MRHKLDADTLIKLMSAWNSLPGVKFHKAYPFFRPNVREVIEEYELGDAQPGGTGYGTAVAILFAEYADAISAQGTEARRAETENTGSVHDGPVAKPCAQNMLGPSHE